jgi:Uncharacterized protein conserved in bacteria (DUF2066)
MGQLINTTKLLLPLLLSSFFAGAVLAAGPVETSVYSVQGVLVDVTEANAAAAKEKALVDVQLKALVALAEKLGNPDFALEMAKLDAKAVVPMLKSLSIEEEKISPGRYEGKFTVRFLPEQVKPLFRKYGISLPASQGTAMLVIPVWSDGTNTVLWEDNPWRKAWLALNASQAQIPIIIPLGDQDDSAILSPQDALNNDPVKLEALRRRYDVKTLLVAFAEPAEGGGIHARMIGKSPLGKIIFDKNYVADSGTQSDSALLAVQRFHKVMIDKYQSDVAKADATKAEQQAAANSGPQSVSVSIPFAGPSQWNGLRSRIISTPGVLGLDLTSLDGQGASARLAFAGSIDDMKSSLQSAGLQLTRSGGTWVIQAL